MNFKTVVEAFNYWNGKTVKEIEQRAQEIKGTIETDPNVDIKSLNIELTGLSQAKENVQEKELLGLTLEREVMRLLTATYTPVKSIEVRSINLLWAKNLTQ